MLITNATSEYSFRGFEQFLGLKIRETNFPKITLVAKWLMHPVRK
jgi:hypothetical protein